MSKNKPADELRKEYFQLEPVAKSFSAEVVKQVETLIELNKIQLGFPVQARIKTWASIEEKVTRVGLKLRSISDLQDVIGIRVIFLFKRDADRFHEVILNTFEVIKKENTTRRLREDQFGYSSMHYVVKFPRDWLVVPAMMPFNEMKAEIQVRTIAQHLWADASHILQYKNEENVPEPIKRSIYRVSAILEIVDLEFERVLNERESYRQEIRPEDKGVEKLNTDLLEIVLDSLLPPQNKDVDERYDELLIDLNRFNVSDVNELRSLVSKNMEAIQAEEQEAVYKKKMHGLNEIDDPERVLNRGVFFTHVGLIRTALAHEFKDRWRDYSDTKIDF